MHKVGFIGLGAMGRWMAERLVEKVDEITVFDVDEKALEPFDDDKANIAESVVEVAQKSEIVILMLPNSKIVHEVVLGKNGLIEHLNEDSIIIDMSSSYSLDTENLKTLLDERSVHLIDAPVSGGVPKAKSGELTIMVGGAENDFAQVHYLLEYLGKDIKHIGKTGSGHALKAINNYLAAASMYATSEAMILAKKLGIDPEVAVESVNTSTGKSHSSEFKYPTYVLPREFSSSFSLDLQLKDINMAKDMAKEVDMPMLLGSSLIEIYESAVNLGGKGQDHTEIIKFLETISNDQLTKKNT